MAVEWLTGHWISLAHKCAIVFALVLDNINISEYWLLYKKSICKNVNISLDLWQNKWHHVLELGLLTEPFVDDDVGPIIYHTSNEILTCSNYTFKNLNISFDVWRFSISFGIAFGWRLRKRYVHTCFVHTGRIYKNM